MIEPQENKPSLNEGTKESLPKKKSRLGNIKNAVNKAIAEVGIAGSLLGGTVAPEVASTALIPETAATITAMAPTTGTAVKTIALGTAAALASACHDDLDTTAPKIDVVQNQIEIQGGETLRISGNQIYVGNTLIFRCSDNVSSNLSISATFNGKSISSGYPFNESGTLSIKTTDEAGNPSFPASAQINKKEAIEEIKFTVLKSQVDFSKGGETSLKDKEFFVGNEKLVTWTENNYTPSLKFDGKDVKIGYVIENEGVLTFTLTNDKGISKSTNINAVDGNEAPEIQLVHPEANIFGGVKVIIKDNQLFFGDKAIAKGTDDNSENLNIKFEVDDKEVKSGETLNISSNGIHTGKLTATDEKNKSSNKEIKLENNINKVVTGMDNINKLSMQVDREVNLLNGIKFNGAELSKVEIEIDGKCYEISDPYHYIPTNSGTCKLILTLKGEFGNNGEISSSTLTIKGIEYQSIPITNIKPVDILPIIGQIDEGDEHAYDHIEHLRVAEATRIRDMMHKYGTGKHSPEEYQALMDRLNTGMRGEIPLGYDNYEILGTQGYMEPSNHAHVEWSILNSIIKYGNFKILFSDFGKSRGKIMIDYMKDHPNSINIFGSSSYADTDTKQNYEKEIFEENVIDLCNSKNFIIFAAGTNIKTPGGVLKNKIYNGEYQSDEQGVYSLASMANSNKNNYPNSHLLVTISTDKTGDINQTNESTPGSSKYPIGFANNTLFAGRIFPYHSQNSGLILATDGKYATSEPNYVNVALTDLCFQIHADVKDVDELLNMIRSTTLTDYIRLDLNGDGDTNDNINGQTETLPLQLINPAGVFKKYCMITDIPSSVKSGEIIAITKGYYKGIIFDIPGAEVKINGQWIPYNKSNESLIKSQNPMNLEWRLNTSEAIKYGNKNLKGKIIAVDDEWNGLNIEKDINVNIQ